MSEIWKFCNAQPFTSSLRSGNCKEKHVLLCYTRQFHASYIYPLRMQTEVSKEHETNPLTYNNGTSRRVEADIKQNSVTWTYVAYCENYYECWHQFYSSHNQHNIENRYSANEYETCKFVEVEVKKYFKKKTVFQKAAVRVFTVHRVNKSELCQHY